MIDDETAQIDPALAHDLEDAIMFGKPHELKLILDGHNELPGDLRQSLESLHYFRSHYDDRSVLNELEKKKITLMDAAWAMELLNKLRARVEAAVKRVS